MLARGRSDHVVVVLLTVDVQLLRPVYCVRVGVFVLGSNTGRNLGGVLFVDSDVDGFPVFSVEGGLAEVLLVVGGLGLAVEPPDRR